MEGGTLYPWVDCPPLLHVNSDYVHRDKIGEIVFSILLKGCVHREGLSETSNNQALLNPFTIT